MYKGSIHRSLFCAFILCFSCLHASAHNLCKPPVDSSSLLGAYEDTLRQLQYDRAKPHTTDEQKLKANTRFTALLEKALMLPNSFNYPFDSLTTIARLVSPDKQFRILNWNVPKADGSSDYFGFIQSLDPVKKIYRLYPLINKSSEINNPQAAVCSPDKWIGMLYYKIVPEKSDDKTIYILLAWQGYSQIITHKVIDVLTFNNQGIPVFGKAVFRKLPPGYHGSLKRIIFQYSSTAYMSLEYNDEKNMLQFDHLGPIDDALVGQYQYYAPSFQVDGFAWKNNSFEYVENIDARNPASSMDKEYHPEEKNYKENKKPIYTPH